MVTMMVILMGNDDVSCYDGDDVNGNDDDGCDDNDDADNDNING